MSVAEETIIAKIPLPSGQGPAWMTTLRNTGMDHYQKIGLPTNSEEEWRFTNLRPIAAIDWQLPDSAEVSSLFAEHSLRAQRVIEIVFVNGIFAPELCSLNDLPRGLNVGNSGVLTSDLARKLASLAAATLGAFPAINAAMLQDIGVLHVAAGVAVDRPIHVLFLSNSNRPAIVAPRLLVVAEPGAVLQFAETYISRGQVLETPVTEIIGMQDTVIDHVRLSTGDARHVSSTHVSLQAAAQFITHSLTLDGVFTRNDLDIALAGQHAHATLNGAVLLTGSHFCDNHTLIRHEQPQCTSHELYKHVIDGSAFGVFKGKILVRPGAQQTDAKQTSKTLLVADSAKMESMPALEIYADDVKCTHGSTIGPLDEDMVFYLRSRGLSLDAARHLLTYAFAADVTRRLRIEPLRRRVEDYLAREQDLPLDLRITEAGAHDEAVVD